MAIIAAFPLATDVAAEGKQRAVLELFTSQGCSSCPPADALIGAMADRDDIVALSLAVDYWDYLGWKDTLASHANTERQRAYAKARGDGKIYTPQIVVNGMAHAVGSRRNEVETAIERTTAALGKSYTEVALRTENGELVVEVGAAPEGSALARGTVLLAHLTGSAKVTIGHGENAGRSITYHNVVRKLEPIGEWTGTPTTVRVPLAKVMSDGVDGCAVLLQAAQAGPIIGAAQLKSW